MLKKTPLGQVLGLGSAKAGTEHWWHQRVTAIAGIPLVIFLIGFVLGSLFGFVAGLAAGPFLIHQYGINSIVSQGLLVVVSVSVNFVCRKFFVFKG